MASSLPRMPCSRISSALSETLIAGAVLAASGTLLAADTTS